MRAGAIVAIASARGQAPRAVIRLAGPLACVLTEQRFSPDGGLRYDGSARGATLGRWRMPPWLDGIPVDIWTFKGPASACGVDVVEIHLPSSPYLSERLVDDLVAGGAALAEPGEFTRMAVENGRLDLTRAEGVLALIRARDDAEAKSARGRLMGGLSRVLEAFESEIVDLLVPIEAGLDFSDQDFRADIPTGAARHAHELGQRLAEFSASEERECRRQNYRVVLRGSVNAGKSTLWNALTHGAAITSPRAGTTRDPLVGSFTHADIEVLVVDTAGIGEALDSIDAAAQERALVEVQSADLVVSVADLRKRDFQAGAGLRIGTHSDVYHGSIPEGVITVCALTGSGLDALKLAIFDALMKHRDATPLLLGSRVSAGLRAASAAIERGAAALLDHPPEFAAADFRDALRLVRALRFAAPGDPVLDRIFSSFCIGK